MPESTQQCNWCLRAYPFISRHFTAIELRVHIQDVHPKVMVMSVLHRCPHEACLDVGSTTFDFAHEVGEHLEKVHGGLVGEWKEREEAKKRKEKKVVVEQKMAWGLKSSPQPSSEDQVPSIKEQEGEKQMVDEKVEAEKEVGEQTKAWRPYSLPEYSFDARTLNVKAGHYDSWKARQGKRFTVCLKSCSDLEEERKDRVRLREKISKIVPRQAVVDAEKAKGLMDSPDSSKGEGPV